MSFDLFFFGGRAVTQSALIRYFQGASVWYRFQQLDSGDLRVLYVNQVTGVYCWFDCQPQAPGPDGAGLQYTGVSFGLNYGRPSFFALEAMAEVEAFAAHFDLLVEDPQDEPGGRGPKAPRVRSAAELVASWQRANSQALPLFGMPYLPRARSDSFWQYTRHRDELQVRYPELMLPPMFVFRENATGTLFTTAAWWEGVAQCFPPCDRIVYGRKAQGLYGRHRQAEETWVIHYDDLLAVAGQYLEPVPGPVDGLLALPPWHTGTVKAIFDRATFHQPWVLEQHTMVRPDQFTDELVSA